MIIVGTASGGGPLVANSGFDVGLVLNYFTTQQVSAFAGWKDNAQEFQFASNSTVSGQNITVNSLGNIRAGNANLGNLITANYYQGVLTTGAQPNITSVGTLSTLNVTGNISSSGNIVGVHYGDGSHLIGLNTWNYTQNQNIIANGFTITGLPSLSVSGTVTGTTFSGSGASLTNLPAGNIIGSVSSAGTVTASAQPNITSVGTLSSLSVTGTVTAGTLSGSHTGSGAGLSGLTGGNVSGQVGNALVAGTVYTAAQPNITSVGTLSSLSVTGTATAATFSGAHTGSGAGLSGLIGGNVSGQVGNALVAGTVYTAAQPNITSVGTLSSLSVTGTVTAGTFSGSHTGSGAGLTSIPASAISGTVASATTATTASSATTATTATNLSGGTVSATTISASGNISTSNYLLGNAYYMTGINFSGTIPWTSVTSKPTTIAGYGITDAVSTSTLSGYATTSSLSGYATTSSLGSYATQSYVTSQGYLTTSSLSSYATTSSLSSYLPTSGGTISGSLTISGGLTVSGTAGIYASYNITAYSDDRLKTKLGNIESALDKIDQLSGFYYEANETAQEMGFKKKREVGLSAQQTQQVMPETVVNIPNTDYLTIMYEKLMPLVIEGIKELRQDIKEIKQQLKGE